MSDVNDGNIRKDPWTGEEFEVVWDGGPLLGPRNTKITDPGWEPPKRLYNRKAKGSEPTKPVEIDQDVSDAIDQEFITIWGSGDQDAD